MAFNWPAFWTRAFTALIFVAVMMWGLLFNPWSLLILLSLIYFGCWREYTALIETITRSFLHPYAKWGGALIGYHIVVLLGAGDLQIGAYSVRQHLSLPFLLAGLVLFVWGLFQTPMRGSSLLWRLLVGWLYIALPIGLLLQLCWPVYEWTPEGDRSIVIAGKWVVLFLIGSVWINDTMAYLAGSAIGKTPLSPISPKKTWEGTLSGIILSAACTWLLFSLVFFKQIVGGIALPGVLISLVTAVTGTFGDLFESKLKRLAGVKDSGRILPGHGGFLDRFDSILFAVPAVWLAIRILLG